MSVGAASPGSLPCPHCGYDLRSLTESRCPECGKPFEAAALAQIVTRSRRLRVFVSSAVMTLAVYAPYAWLLVIEYPWNDYRWHWVRMWPGLPLLLVSSLGGLRRFLEHWLHIEIDGTVGIVLLSALSLLLLYGLIRLGTRGTRWLVITALVLLALSSVNSFILYGLFLM